jgi:cell cycle checkpoint protein
MGRHIQISNVPTVLIYSDVRESKHQPRDLERLVDPQNLYSEAVTIMQCHPVTKARMKNILEAICKKENVEVPANFCEEVHLQSGGDLRHAIMSLQFRGIQKTTGRNNYGRDAKLSIFHTLGKLLYAKRQKVNELSTERTARAPLDFDPERVMEQSGMELGGAVTFLGYHCPDFFTDVSELSEAFDHYSDSAMLLDQSNEVNQCSEITYCFVRYPITVSNKMRVCGCKIQRDTTFPGGYVASIAGRAVADANKHPAPSSFRSLSTPKIFEVMRNRRANEVTMLQLCKRLSLGSDTMPLDTNLGGSRTFVTDLLPYMRTIVPSGKQWMLSCGDVNFVDNHLTLACVSRQTWIALSRICIRLCGPMRTEKHPPSLNTSPGSRNKRVYWNLTILLMMTAEWRRLFLFGPLSD